MGKFFVQKAVQWKRWANLLNDAPEFLPILGECKKLDISGENGGFVVADCVEEDVRDSFLSDIYSLVPPHRCRHPPHPSRHACTFFDTESVLICCALFATH